MHTTGPDLKQARNAAGLTQTRVAEALSVTRVTIANWEARAVVPPGKAERYLRVVSELATGAS